MQVAYGSSHQSACHTLWAGASGSCGSTAQALCVRAACLPAPGPPASRALPPPSASFPLVRLLFPSALSHCSVPHLPCSPTSRSPNPTVSAQVILNSEVWDLRTFRLLRSVPSLDGASVLFNGGGDVLYAVRGAGRGREGRPEAAEGCTLG